MIKNLVFKGGGPKGCLIHCGALGVLDDAKLISNVQNYAGTSAGSIIAGLLACGYSPQDLHDIIYALDFSKFKDSNDPLRFPFKCGLHTGDYFLTFLLDLVKKRKGDGYVTFRDMPWLHVIATNFNTGLEQVFNSVNTPSIPIAFAIRASMSIPIFFDPFPIGDSVYVDGGMINNFPLSLFDQPEKGLYDANTVGISMMDINGLHKRVPFEKTEPVDFALQLFNILESAQTDEEILDNDPRRIICDTQGVSSTDFAPPKEAMLLAGSSGAKNYLALLKMGQ